MKELAQAGGILIILYALLWGVIGWFFLEPALELLDAIIHVILSLGDYIAGKA